MKDAKTPKQLKAALSTAIDRMLEMLNSDETSESQKTQAANALKGLVREYCEQFPGEEEQESKLRSVKDF